MTESADLLARIPHRGPMCFLDEVVAVDGHHVHTRTTLRPDFLLLRDGAASPMVAIELFAQTAAVSKVVRYIENSSIPQNHGFDLSFHRNGFDYWIRTVILTRIHKVSRLEVEFRVNS